MLARLSIRDIVLIERLDIEFSRGLAVLTGETGAGKSILLDAFALALGGRGDSGLVRHGAEQGQVTATFDVPKGHPAAKILSENGLDDTGEMILRRVQLADGRTRAFINDVAVGHRAEVQLTGVNYIERPRLYGTVHTVSADRLTDDKSGQGYYAVEVALDPNDVKKSRIDLQAGTASGPDLRSLAMSVPVSSAISWRTSSPSRTSFSSRVRARRCMTFWCSWMIFSARL